VAGSLREPRSIPFLASNRIDFDVTVDEGVILSTMGSESSVHFECPNPDCDYTCDWKDLIGKEKMKCPECGKTAIVDANDRKVIAGQAGSDL
jgi:predicted RNA-binding Zn-ribbon protein involved in translation (DUF1610 family)